MTLTATDIQLYEILKQKPGSKEAEALVEFADGRIKETTNAIQKILSRNNI